MKKFQLITEPRGYTTKPDSTNTAESNLVSGSKNVLINDQDRIETRKGFELDGASSVATTPIRASFDWRTSTKIDIHLRAYDDELETRFVKDNGDIVWHRIKDGYSTTADFQFTTWWDTTETIDLLFYVIGDSNIYEWSGGQAQLASATTNTITKTGTETFAQSRFYTTRNKVVVINGTEYTYTGGETTTTLTGVTPDPSAEAVDSIITQKVVVNSNKPQSNSVNDIISTLNNQVYVASVKENEVYVSADTGILDYSAPTSPRIPGESATLTLDSPVVALVSQEQNMYIGAGLGEWYETLFTQLDVGGTLTETLAVKKLKVGNQQAPISHNLVSKAKNNIVFISNEPTMDTLGRVENVDTPQSKPISDPIKPDFNAEDFTNGDTIYFRNQQFISAPVNSTIYIYDYDKGYWQPPQTLPIRRFAIINGELYGHSSERPETYKLFTGTNDNGNSFNSVAAFAYRNFNDRINYKQFEEFYTEGYISANTTLKLTINYELDGTAQQIEKLIDGSDSSIVIERTIGGSLGDTSLGDLPIGGEGGTAGDVLPKFRVINKNTPYNFHEVQFIYSTDAIDYQWQILAHGPAIRLSTYQPNKIKQ